MPPLPPVTKAFILACVGVFCFFVLFPSLAFWFELWPLQSGAFLPWQPLSYAFLHGDFMHLLFNMLGLWMFGGELERVWGARRYTQILLASTLSAAAIQLAFTWAIGTNAPTVGASGAIFALGGALLVSAWRLRRRLAPSRARAMGGALLFLVGQGLAAGFTRNATDNAAHAGGVVAGALLGTLLPLSPRLGGAATGWPLRALGALAALVLALSLLLAVRGGLAGR